MYVSLVQGTTAIEKTGEDLDVAARTVGVWLTQEESLGLKEGTLDVQINWTYLDSDNVTVRRAATKTKSITITRQLLKRVIE